MNLEQQSSQDALVSVIIPCYNHGNTLLQALDSVLAQTYTNLEVLIVNDASDDPDTVKIIEKCEQKDERVRVIHHQINSGLCVVRNTGFDNAKGDFIAYLDDDDCWHPNKLQIQIPYFEKYSELVLVSSWYDVCTASLEPIFTASPKTKFLNYKKLLLGNIIGCPTIVIRRSALGRLRCPDKRVLCEDYILNLKLLKSTGKTTKSACIVHESTAKYRLTPSSLSSNKFKMIKGVWRVFREFEKLNIVYALYCMLRTATGYIVRKHKQLNPSHRKSND